MKATVQSFLRAGLLLALFAVLVGCGTAPTAQGQGGTVGDERPAQNTALDQGLLSQVDSAIAAAKARGEDVTAAQDLRDSAVSLGQQGHAAEANGNLKTAALQLGVLEPVGGGERPQTSAAIPQAPKPAAIASAQGTLVLNAAFQNEASLDGWAPVGPSIPTGTPLWEVQDGLLVQRGVDGVDAVEEQTGFVTGDAAWSNGTVQVSALARDTREVGVIFRQQGESFYRFRALVVGTGSDTGNYILEKVLDGQVSPIATFNGRELSANVWHTLSVTANGSSITVAVDGQQLGSAEDSSLTAGRVGVSTLAMSGAYFANVQVTRR